MPTKENTLENITIEMIENNQFSINDIIEYMEKKQNKEIMEMELQTETETEEFQLNTILAIVVMVYIAFNFYFMLEKFKIKD